MPSFLQNKYVKYSALAILALIVLSFLWVLLNLFSGGGSMGSTGLGGGSLYAPSASMDYASEKVSLSRGEEMDSSFMPIPPAPSSGGYTSDLEKI